MNLSDKTQYHCRRGFIRRWKANIFGMVQLCSEQSFFNRRTLKREATNFAFHAYGTFSHKGWLNKMLSRRLVIIGLEDPSQTYAVFLSKTAEDPFVMVRRRLYSSGICCLHKRLTYYANREFLGIQNIIAGIFWPSF